MGCYSRGATIVEDLGVAAELWILQCFCMAFGFRAGCNAGLKSPGVVSSDLELKGSDCGV